MTKLTTFTGLLALCTSVAFAQPPVATPTPLTAGQQPSNPAATANVPQADRDFVTKAAVSGMFEVQSSQMATTASQDSAVQEFARQMVADHTAANQELLQLAGAKNIQVPQALDQKHMQMIQRLGKATGQQFDTTYGRQQVRAHKEAVALFTKASTDLSDPDLKAFAVKTLPVLQHHAEMAQRLPGADQAGKQSKKQPKQQQ
jgi:putative membrane protein